MDKLDQAEVSLGWRDNGTTFVFTLDRALLKHKLICNNLYLLPVPNKISNIKKRGFKCLKEMQGASEKPWLCLDHTSNQDNKLLQFESFKNKAKKRCLISIRQI